MSFHRRAKTVPIERELPVRSDALEQFRRDAVGLVELRRLLAADNRLADWTPSTSKIRSILAETGVNRAEEIRFLVPDHVRNTGRRSG